MGRIRSAALLVALMLVGSLALWVGMPLLALWVGSQVEAASGSIGLALLAMAACAGLTIAALVSALGHLRDAHAELQAARGAEDYGGVVLEAVLALSAGAAVVGFAIWFLFLADRSGDPVPIF